MRPALVDRRIVRRRFTALAKIGMKLPLLACDFTFEIWVSIPVEATRSGVLTVAEQGRKKNEKNGCAKTDDFGSN